MAGTRRSRGLAPQDSSETKPVLVGRPGETEPYLRGRQKLIS